MIINNYGFFRVSSIGFYTCAGFEALEYDYSEQSEPKAVRLDKDVISVTQNPHALGKENPKHI